MIYYVEFCQVKLSRYNRFRLYSVLVAYVDVRYVRLSSVLLRWDEFGSIKLSRNFRNKI